MSQLGKIILLGFFVNFLVGNNNKGLPSNIDNSTYSNMSLVKIQTNNYEYLNDNYHGENQFQSIHNNYNTYFVQNCSNIGFFQGLFNLIQVLVGRYFDVFQICYLRSINIIYYLVTDYFLVFNRLFFTAFGQVVSLVNNIMLINFVNGYHLITILFSTPNIAILSFLIMYVLYLGHERTVLQTLNNNRIAYELRTQTQTQTQNRNQTRNQTQTQNRNRNRNQNDNVNDF